VSDSLAKTVSKLSPEKQQEWLENLPDEQVRELAKLPWWFIGRPEQFLPEGDWNIWLIQTGRGWGKTRSCAEALADLVLASPLGPEGDPTEWGIFADTFSDCRKVCVEGPSGFLKALRGRGLSEGRDFTYNRSLWQIILTTGQVIHMVGADTPDAGRGLNLSGLWADEIAKWRYSYQTWTEGIMLALRIGKNPRAIVSTTPKRTELLKLWNHSDDGSVYVTRGSIFDNADNLSPAQLKAFKEAYEGTRIGRQELYGELLEDVPGALWKYDDILIDDLPETKRIVIAVDPAVSNSETSDETGIVAVAKGIDGRFYVLGDQSCRDSVLGWAKRVNAFYEQLGADAVVYEDNQGGDAIKEVLLSVNPYMRTVAVRAKISKRLRAEPVAALYEQHKVSHVEHFEKLETQMLEWDAEDAKSPDRLDALVHAITELMDLSPASRFMADLALICGSCGQPNLRDTVVCAYCFKPL
jgi:phage terminase large subunit-like protein